MFTDVSEVLAAFIIRSHLPDGGGIKINDNVKCCLVTYFLTVKATYKVYMQKNIFCLCEFGGGK
jgi:hypothetical protein